jgi:hypothetical protein
LRGRWGGGYYRHFLEFCFIISTIDSREYWITLSNFEFSIFFTDAGPLVTTITLDHTLFTGLAYPSHMMQIKTTLPPATRPPVTRPPATRPPTARPPTILEPYSSYEEMVDSDFECGITDYKAPSVTGLIVGGKKANRGQFPW